MSDSNKQGLSDTIEQLTTVPKGTRLSRWQSIVRVIAISIPVLGAIPTAWTLYQSYVIGVDYEKVAHAEAQQELWLSNLDCLPKFAPFNTGQGTSVGVAACPRTGDIAIRIELPDGGSTQEWVSFADLKEKVSKTTASLGGLFISQAVAATLRRPAKSRSGNLQLAATSVEVQCQALTDKKMILRIVKENGKCFKETVSPFKGSVEKREEVPCDTQCKPAA